MLKKIEFLDDQYLSLIDDFERGGLPDS